MLLVNVCQFHGFTHFEVTLIHTFQAHDETEECSLTCTVRTNYTYDAVRRKHEVEVVEEQLVAVCLLHTDGFDDLVTQARTVRDEDFELFFLFLHVFVEELVVRVQTSLTLRLTSLWSHAHPFQLAFEGLAALAGSLFFHFHALGLLFEPAGVVTLPWNTFATVEFKNPSGNVVEEVTVVGDTDHGTFVLLQVLFQPVDGFGIEVVGRFVEKQYIRLLEQQAAQSHTAAFTTRKHLHRLVFGRTAESVHGAFQLAVEVPSISGIDDVLQFCLTGKEGIHLVRVFVIFRKTELIVDFFVFVECIHNRLDTFHHHFLHGLGVVQLRFLCEVSYGITR